MPGSTITFRLSFQNLASVDGVLDAIDTYDSTNLTFSSASVAGYTHNGSTLTWSDIPVSANGTWTVDVTFTIKSTASIGTIVPNLARYDFSR